MPFSACAVSQEAQQQRTALCSRNRIPRIRKNCKHILQKFSAFSAFRTSQLPACSSQQPSRRWKQPQAPPCAPDQPDHQARQGQRRTAPAHLATCSPAAGPAHQLAARQRAFPPSRGRTGNRLNAPRARWAPAGTGAPAEARAIPQSRLANGPASTAQSSPG